MAKTIAVIGASSARRKFGNKCVRAYQRLGYDVFPVHPSETVVEGRPAFKSVLDIPLPSLDVVSIYLPEPAALKVLPEIAQKQVGEVWFNPGADALAVLALARQLGLTVVVGCSIVAVGAMPDD